MPPESMQRRIVQTALFFVVALAGYAAGAIDDREAVAEQAVTYEQLGVFAEVLGLVQTRYVDETDNREMVRAAIRGMLVELDPHTVLLDPEQLAAMRADTRGEYVGVGIVIQGSDRGIVISEVFEGGPARDAGVQAGDLITSIDGEDASDFQTQDCVERLRGPRGERVSIGLLRTLDDGAEQAMVVDVVRDVIHTPAVEAEMLSGGVGWVQIRSFQSNTGGELRSAVDRLQSEHGAELTGVVLDLRNNPGGLLSEAVTVADAFLTDGRIVSTGGRLDADESVSEATRSGTRFRGPLAVLVNGGSASASEIVAGALQDRGRATVVGLQTYGKGSVQSIIDLQDGSGLKLTISRYYTPSGRSIDGEGITPDLRITAQEGEEGDAMGEALPAELAELGDRQLGAAVRLLLNPIEEPPTTEAVPEESSSEPLD